jgi:hypothetical protein
MTVIEAVRTYGLQDYAKTYYNWRNNTIPFPDLDNLPNERVRRIDIDPNRKSVVIFCYLYGESEH